MTVAIPRFARPQLELPASRITVNPQSKNLVGHGFDLVKFLCERGRIPRSTGNSLEIWPQGLLAREFSAHGLAVQRASSSS